MIVKSAYENDPGTIKTTMELDDDFKHGIMLDSTTDDMLMLIFETLDERMVIPFICKPENREKAAEILADAFEEIRQHLQEDDDDG